MLLHFKLLPEFLTIVYTIVIAGYSINNIIRKIFYRYNGKTDNHTWLAFAELITKQENYYCRINAALQDSHKNTSVEISNNIIEPQYNPGNTKRKRKQFPLLKTATGFMGYLKLCAATKSFTKNSVKGFVLSFKYKMHYLLFLKITEPLSTSLKII